MDQSARFRCRRYGECMDGTDALIAVYTQPPGRESKEYRDGEINVNVNNNNNNNNNKRDGGESGDTGPAGCGVSSCTGDVSLCQQE